MLIEAARRAEAAVKEMLACADSGDATTGELRDALGVSKAIAGFNSAFQASAAAAVAGRETSRRRGRRGTGFQRGAVPSGRPQRGQDS